MIIRDWLFDDNKQIEQLEKKYFKDAWNFQMLSQTFITDSFIGLVAEDNGIVVGYVGSIHQFEDGEITLICVDENYRRQHLATKLLDELAIKLKENDVERLLLEVRRSNYTAQLCYVKYGFKVLGIRANYYENTEDALIMEKFL